MRDDIHKHAPLSRRWQAVMRHFQSAAERPTALDAMHRAVAMDIREFIGSDFLRVLRAAFDKPQLPLKGVPPSYVSVGDPTKSLSDIERAIHERLGFAQKAYPHEPELLGRVLTETLTDRVLANCQAMETT